jgi:hypothetical protein
LTERGTNIRTIMLASDWDVGLGVEADPPGRAFPRYLSLTALGRREIRDLIDLLEWAAKTLREDLSEEQIEADEAKGKLAMHPAVAKHWLPILRRHVRLSGDERT